MRYYLTFVFNVLMVVCIAQSTPVNTTTKEISYQDKKTYEIDGIFLSNEFKGARLNGVSLRSDTITITIEAENEPINTSPWYAFKIWASSTKNVVLHFNYVNGLQRYFPKLSKDGTH